MAVPASQSVPSLIVLLVLHAKQKKSSAQELHASPSQNAWKIVRWRKEMLAVSNVWPRIKFLV